MDFKTLQAPKDGLCAISADALLLVLAAGSVPASLEATLAAAVKGAVDAGDLALEAGRALYLHRVPGLKATRLAVTVCAASAAPAAWRKALAAGMALLKGGGARHVAVALVGADAGAEHAEALVALAEDATYVYRHTKPSAPAASRLERLSLVCEKAQAKAIEAGLARGRAIAAGVALARELANRPANHCTPSHLAAEARALARRHARLAVQVLERKDAEKLGMGAFLAVAQASHQAPKFIVLRWQGAGTTKVARAPKAAKAPVVLVGKGITFDTGGVSLKPAPEMDEMKFDMGGAASVLGTFAAVAELGLAIDLVGLVPACENMPGGGAVKPGDVVKSLSGQTIEILNTDAEGRLILCDALTYAERFKPAAVVDIATLTGACVIALGHHRSGLFSTDEALAASLLEAGERAGDLAWRLPLDEAYDEALKSNFADMGNVGGRPGGAITAAKFLQRFASRYGWAHLDIAGTAWKSGKEKGATGRPVPLLTHFLIARAG
ncbi:MAG: leucyl aminopeptidase [Rubrivivax sp. SCN 71-131]|jgi:leucyl aminopeptidase|nr:MAG: leucyl aminopeptidase [Rubrivivax sp. SCN 71-131]